MSVERARILVATSGSEASAHAVQTAAGLAGALGADLVIVHVGAAVEYRVARLAPALAVTRRLEDPHGSPVLSEARRLALECGAAARLALLSGDPPTAIAALAEELDAELVLLGARPGGGQGCSRSPFAARSSAGAHGRCSHFGSAHPTGRRDRRPRSARYRSPRRLEPRERRRRPR